MAGVPPPPRHVQLRTATRGSPDRGTGSRTMTIEHDDDDEQGQGTSGRAHPADGFDDGVLRLRAGPTHGNRVSWEEGTVDNEFLNRKKSKICCIYHKPKTKNFEDPFADSSSSSESSESDSEGISGSDCSSCDEDLQASTSAHAGDGVHDGAAAQDKPRHRHKRRHRHTEGCTGDHGENGHDHEHAERRPPPNAYERQPRYGKFKKSKSKSKSKNKSSTVTVTEEPKGGPEPGTE